jgi:hypothetical protein
MASEDARRLYETEGGLSSPNVSPDGRSLLIVQGVDELLKIDVSSGAIQQFGSALSAFWTRGGGVAAYTREKEGKCHVLTRRDANGTFVSKSETCIGMGVVPVSAGEAPDDAPLPVIDREGAVIELLGSQARESPSGSVHLELGVLGIGCSRGIEYLDRDGKYVSVIRGERGWEVRGGVDVCGQENIHTGFVKVGTCDAAESK